MIPRRVVLAGHLRSGVRAREHPRIGDPERVAGVQWGHREWVTGVTTVASAADGFVFGTRRRGPFLVELWQVETDQVQDGFGLIGALRFGAVLGSLSASWTAGVQIAAVLPSQDPQRFEPMHVHDRAGECFVIRYRNLTTVTHIITTTVAWRELESYDALAAPTRWRLG